MPAPHRTHDAAACAFARRHDLCGVDGAPITSVRELELTLATLPLGKRTRQNWRTLCSRYRARRGETAAPYVLRRPTAPDRWLAAHGVASGDVIAPALADTIRRELDRSWRRYHPQTPQSAAEHVWRHRRGAEWAIAMCEQRDGSYIIGVCRIVQRRSVTGFVPMGTTADQRRATNRRHAH